MLSSSRSRTETRLVGIFVALWFLGSIGDAQLASMGFAREDATTQTDARAAAQATFGRFEAAWRQGDADAIVSLLAPGQVLMRLPGQVARPRRYSHAQCALILRDHFATHDTRRFEFHHQSVPATATAKATALANVSWRTRGRGRVLDGRLLVVIEHGDAGWRVVEIQAVP